MLSTVVETSKIAFAIPLAPPRTRALYALRLVSLIPTVSLAVVAQWFEVVRQSVGGRVLQPMVASRVTSAVLFAWPLGEGPGVPARQSSSDRGGPKIPLRGRTLVMLALLWLAATAAWRYVEAVWSRAIRRARYSAPALTTGPAG